MIRQACARKLSAHGLGCVSTRRGSNNTSDSCSARIPRGLSFSFIPANSVRDCLRQMSRAIHLDRVVA